MTSYRVLAFTMAVSVPWCGTASAQSEGEPTAEALFASGRAAMEAGNFEAACESFRKSQRLEPAIGSLMNLAECERRRGMLATALALFQKVRGGLGASDSRHAVVDERIATLSAQVPRLTVHVRSSAPPATTVRRDQQQLSAAMLDVAFPVEPGAVQLTTSAPGFEDQTTEVRLAPGEQLRVEVEPGARLGASSPVADADASQPEPRRPGGRRTAGIVVASVGAASALFGALSGLYVVDQKQNADKHCDGQRVCDATGMTAVENGRRWASLSTASLIIGAAGLGFGLALALTDDSKATGAPVVSVGARADRGLGVSISRAW